MIVVIDYGMGNTGSLHNMVRKAGGASEISSDLSTITRATKLILPGVGSFDNGMKKLKETGIADVLNKRVCEDKIPILCICLGIQLITLCSEEGTLPGFGWIKAETIRFKFSSELNLRIPHMGWNTVVQKKASPLLLGLQEESRFYFVHSYHVNCANKEDVLTTTTYGIEFVSSIQHENIFATQFHPEKSHKFGLNLIKNFVEL
ncbi:MAG TPA: imidazole glycerol phosphate synthase subunit HisH [Chitinivibrionales bacterium]|nr:imidazole glycerol phosphate synthase subunit HisH [Chitinivibrionales bacterium]